MVLVVDRARGSQLFAERTKGMAGISSESLRKGGQDRLNETRLRYGGILRSGRTAGRFLVILVTLSCLALSEPLSATGSEIWGNLSRGPHGVGFRLLQDMDPSRSFQGKSRPIRIYLWYPTGKSSGSAMSFRDYADLAALDFGSDRRIPIGSERIDPSLPIITSFSEEGMARLMSKELRAVRDAHPGEGRFPVVVLGQGIDFESPLAHVVLCEYLASHGYVVVTTPLLGVHSRLSGVGILDVEAHVRDAEFASGRARDLSFVDSSRLGAAGFDLGGISALLLAMRNPDVKALVTMDCAVQFDNGFLKVPHESPDFNPDRLRIPWIHMMTEMYLREDLPDLGTRSLFAQAKYSEAYFIWIDEVEHANFTSYTMLGLEKPLRGRRPFKKNARPVYEAVCRYVRNFFDAYLQSDPRALDFLQNEPKDNVQASVNFSARMHKAAPAPLDVDDLINCLFGKGLNETLRLAKSSPADETVLDAVGHKVLRWGDAEWATELFQLNVDLYPKSAGVYESLGDAHVRRGEVDLAIRNYNKALALDPEAEAPRIKLNRLKK